MKHSQVPVEPDRNRGTSFLRPSNLRSGVIGLLAALLIAAVAGISFPPEAEAALRHDSATVFPVARYLNPGPNRTGNNYYYASARIPGTESVGIAASGQEDLLVYEENVFETRRMDPLIYHRDIAWGPDGRKAVLGGSRLPPDTGGVLMEYDRERQQFALLAETPINVLSIARRNETILAVGGQRQPQRTGAIYRYRNGNLEELSTPSEGVYQTVGWDPDGRRALIVGEAGTVVEWEGPDRTTVHTIPGRPFLKSLSWHPSGDHALIGGEQGRLYRFQDGALTRISLDLDWTIHDIAWHESGDYALLVGGVGTEDEGYWAHYQNFRAESHQLSRPFFSVSWMNESNAIMAGQRVIWRYSRDQNPEDFELSGSLTVSHPEASVGQKVTLSGFGSTYRASADSVTEYSFRYDTGDTGEWQTEPDHNVKYRRAGDFHPTVLVRGPDGGVARDSATITVEDPEDRFRTGSSLLWYSMIGFVMVALGGVFLLGGFYFLGRGHGDS